MTVNEWIESLGNMEMTTVIAFLFFVIIVIAFMPLITAISEVLAHKIVYGIPKTIASLWRFITNKLQTWTDTK